MFFYFARCFFVQRRSFLLAAVQYAIYDCNMGKDLQFFPDVSFWFYPPQRCRIFCFLYKSVSRSMDCYPTTWPLIDKVFLLIFCSGFAYHNVKDFLYIFKLKQLYVTLTPVQMRQRCSQNMDSPKFGIKPSTQPGKQAFFGKRFLSPGIYIKELTTNE